MAIQPIIDFYGQEPSLPALHDQVVIHMRRHAIKTVSIRTAQRPKAGEANRIAGEILRNRYRPLVLELRDQGLSQDAIKDRLGISKGLVNRIIREAVEQSRSMEAAG